jgi:hypothetical protein
MLTCLGDLFSTNWIEDADSSNMATKTLYDNFIIDQQECITQTVTQWGDVSMQSEVIGNFMSGNVDDQKSKKWWQNLKTSIKSKVFSDKKKTSAQSAGVASRDVKLHMLYSAVMANPSVHNQMALKAEIDHRLYVDDLFASIFPEHMEAVKTKTTPLPTNFDCYREMAHAFTDACGTMDGYSLKYMAAFVAECESAKSSDAGVKAIRSACL